MATFPFLALSTSGFGIKVMLVGIVLFFFSVEEFVCSLSDLLLKYLDLEFSLWEHFCEY